MTIAGGDHIESMNAIAPQQVFSLHSESGRVIAQAGRREPSRALEHVGEQLVAYLPNLRRFAITLCKSRETAEDLVQSACVRALAHAPHFEPGTRFDAWMFRIVRNLWIDHLRRQRTEGPQEDIGRHQNIGGTSAEVHMEDRLLLDSVGRAIDGLAADQRSVLILICLEDLSYQQVADILAIPIGTVMSRLARARKKLGATLGILWERSDMKKPKGGHRRDVAPLRGDRFLPPPPRFRSPAETSRAAQTNRA